MFKKWKRFKANLETATKILSGTIIMCSNPKCRSFEVEHFDVVRVDTEDGKVIETYHTRCRNCGSLGSVEERWNINVGEISNEA